MLSNSSINKAIDALVGLFRFAVVEEYIDVSPAATLSKVPGTKEKVTSLPSTKDFESLLLELQFPNSAENVKKFMSYDFDDTKSQHILASGMGMSLATYKRLLARYNDGTLLEGGHNRNAADLARLLAYTGMRIAEAKNCTWGDINWEKHQLHVAGTKTESSDRYVPLISVAEEFLRKLRDERIGEADDVEIVKCKGINGALESACERLSIPKLTQHDLRHFFGTVCIESGVDIPTVSRWLGHNDGGALLMKTYGHLRDDHSQQEAKKVAF